MALQMNLRDFDPFLRFGRPFHVDGGLLSIVATLLIALLVTGCRPEGSSAPIPTDSSMLRGIVSTYRIAMRDLGHPPQGPEDLKAILAPVAKDPSEYLRSKRDGEDFVIIWGLNLDSTPSNAVVAYERTGVDGKRMVVTADTSVAEVSSEEFANLNFPADHQPGI